MAGKIDIGPKIKAIRLQKGLKLKDVGAADKAAIQLVRVPSYQLLVSDT